MRHNVITQIEEKEIKSLKGLAVLDLAQNNIKDVTHVAKNCRKLKELYLMSNKIVSISEKFYIWLKDLEHLHLSGNPITELHPNIRKMTHLKVLGISFTKIKQLPSSIVELNFIERLLVENTPLVVLVIPAFYRNRNFPAPKEACKPSRRTS